jgi:energy-coupling factor transport system permease protein
MGPAVLGALQDVDRRSLALEARAFDRPGPRQLLWVPADSGRQRLARWLLLVGLLGFIALRAAGTLPRLP